MSKFKYPLPIRKDWIHTIELLSNEEAGMLFTYLWDWVDNRELEAPNRIIDVATIQMKRDILKDLKSYRIGEFSPLWKGGISTENKIDRNCSRYSQWRKDVFERDNFTCQSCGAIGGQLNAHHIEFFSKNKDKRFNVDNGITLCRTCHIEYHRTNR